MTLTFYCIGVTLLLDMKQHVWPKNTNTTDMSSASASQNFNMNRPDSCGIFISHTNSLVVDKSN